MRALLAALVLLWAFPAQADQCTRWQAVGEPCAGMLGPSSQFKRLLLCDTVKLPDCERKRATQVAKLTADLELVTKERDASRKEAGELRLVIVRLGDELREGVPWYDHPALWATLGVALGAVVTWAIVR